MIELVGVQKYYESRLALDVPAFSFTDGGRYALIGPNGSGKTTLLRILAGTLKQDAGTVRYGDIQKSEIGYLPQKPYAFDRSVLENVLLALEPGEEAKKRALAALERVDLGHLAKARGNRLSGGETQRMALARLIAKPRRILLLDEPTSSADIQANDKMENALLEYAKETGCTLIFSSHAPSQAIRLGEYTLALDGGRIGEFGTAEQVLQNPQQESTREFMRHWRI
ncbi:Tungstate uptake system ATP-binding protein TupC [bioreactor metagenome]|uniref:Tungstate uptake system ATP-binding protein TupC n=1 Tax=bioreactor metagenome TaxID=1076179 RepID=A0A644ZD67_9ZZZZ